MPRTLMLAGVNAAVAETQRRKHGSVTADGLLILPRSPDGNSDAPENANVFINGPSRLRDEILRNEEARLAKGSVALPGRM